MTFTRRFSRRAAIGALVSALLAGAGAPVWAAGSADAWPEKPVRMVVPFPPGGPGDIVARSLAEQLRQTWGQPVLVENRPGASGTIGTANVARAEPDGYTVLLAAASHVMNPSMFPKLPFDPVEDFTPIARIAGYPMAVLVNASLPYQSLDELVAAVKREPGTIAVANTGAGSAPQLAAVLFEQRAGVQFLHIPYQGSGPTALALLSGEIKVNFQGSIALEQVRAGKLRALAITGEQRLPDFPDVPTIAELGYPGYKVELWYGVLAPAGLVPEVRDRMYRDIQRAMATDAVKTQLKGAGIMTEDLGPDAFRQSMQEEVAHWASVIEKAGITPQ
ncbi:Bug family tripartite tricarboxylate transporter substrate binding protein [Verticiella sediminum]|nr:tripartite tricarboxylate transporter substrate binding protein [Verticiella sediminum]